MHWNVEDGRYCEALRRLAVVLLTLAAIAESLVHRSAPVRCLLLFLLSRAEARVRDLAFRTGAGGALASMPAELRVPGGSGDAAGLAQRFRALAAAFFTLSRPRRLRLARPDNPVRQSADFRGLIGPGHRAGLFFADTS
jgi:hypothetical protein